MRLAASSPASRTARPRSSSSLPQPAMGPIVVNGIEKGIARRSHRRGNAGRAACGQDLHHSEFGGLVGGGDRVLQSAASGAGASDAVDKSGVRWSDKITPALPAFIGTIGIAPEIEAISSLQPDYHGGNMDQPDVAPGAILYFPARERRPALRRRLPRRPGRRRMSGVAIEQRATVTCRSTSSGLSFAWPRLEAEFPDDDRKRAARGCRAHRLSRTGAMDERRLRLRRDRRLHAAQPAGRVRLGNMVDPKYTMGASILKKYLVS